MGAHFDTSRGAPPLAAVPPLPPPTEDPDSPPARSAPPQAVSWEKELLPLLEFLKKSAAVTLRPDDKRSLLQVRRVRVPLSNLGERDAILPRCVFKFREPVFHRENHGLKHFAKTGALIALPPIYEVGLLRRRVLHDDVLNSALKACSPAQDAFNTCRVGRD